MSFLSLQDKRNTLVSFLEVGEKPAQTEENLLVLALSADPQ